MRLNSAGRGWTWPGSEALNEQMLVSTVTLFTKNKNMLFICSPPTHTSICQNIQWVMTVLYSGLCENLSHWTLTSLSHKIRSVQVRFAPIWTLKSESSGTSSENTFVIVEITSCKCLKLEERKTQRRLRGIIKVFLLHKRGPPKTLEALKTQITPRPHTRVSSYLLDCFGVWLLSHVACGDWAHTQRPEGFWRFVFLFTTTLQLRRTH